VVLDAGIACLTALTHLTLHLEGTGNIQLHDPANMLGRRPRDQLFPALEEAKLLFSSCIKPDALSRLLPAFHHVTQLYMHSNGIINILPKALASLSRIQDLHIGDYGVYRQPGAAAYFALSFPTTLRRLSLNLKVEGIGYMDSVFVPFTVVSMASLAAVTALSFRTPEIIFECEAHPSDPPPPPEVDGKRQQRPIMSLLKFCPDLQELYIDNSGLYDMQETTREGIRKRFKEFDRYLAPVGGRDALSDSDSDSKGGV
jgi:hypothetical protein